MPRNEVEQVFSHYGHVVGISIHKGYGFVQYAHENHARAAVDGEDNKIYYGMALDVTIASEPKNRKRVRSNIVQNNNIPNGAADMQALAAVGGQLSQLVLPSHQQMAQVNMLNSGQFGFAPNIMNPMMMSSGQPMMGMQPGGAYSNSMFPHGGGGPLVTTQSSAAKRTRLEATGVGMNSRPVRNLVNLAGDAPINKKYSRMNNQNNVGPGPRSSHQRHNNYTHSNSSIQNSSNSGNARRDHADRGKSSFASKNGARVPIDNESTGDDILICGKCRRCFEGVTDLMSHKMAGCNLNKDDLQCKARESHFYPFLTRFVRPAGEPESLDCARCGTNFASSWELIHHCSKEHDMLIYRIPGKSPSPPCESPKNDDGEKSSKISVKKEPTNPTEHSAEEAEEADSGHAYFVLKEEDKEEIEKRNEIPESTIGAEESEPSSPVSKVGKDALHVEEEEEEDEEEKKSPAPKRRVASLPPSKSLSQSSPSKKMATRATRATARGEEEEPAKMATRGRPAKVGRPRTRRSEEIGRHENMSDEDDLDEQAATEAAVIDAKQ